MALWASIDMWVTYYGLDWGPDTLLCSFLYINLNVWRRTIANIQGHFDLVYLFYASYFITQGLNLASPAIPALLKHMLPKLSSSALAVLAPMLYRMLMSASVIVADAAIPHVFSRSDQWMGFVFRLSKELAVTGMAMITLYHSDAVPSYVGLNFFFIVVSDAGLVQDLLFCAWNRTWPWHLYHAKHFDLAAAAATEKPAAAPTIGRGSLGVKTYELTTPPSSPVRLGPLDNRTSIITSDGTRPPAPTRPIALPLPFRVHLLVTREVERAQLSFISRIASIACFFFYSLTPAQAYELPADYYVWAYSTLAHITSSTLIPWIVVFPVLKWKMRRVQGHAAVVGASPPQSHGSGLLEMQPAASSSSSPSPVPGTLARDGDAGPGSGELDADSPAVDSPAVATPIRPLRSGSTSRPARPSTTSTLPHQRSSVTSGTLGRLMATLGRGGTSLARGSVHFPWSTAGRTVEEREAIHRAATSPGRWGPRLQLWQVDFDATLSRTLVLTLLVFSCAVRFGPLQAISIPAP
ncbi:hypothetical protein H9P43_000353 [Blastocladiella emersonii ATCC 22665]|nr:hypothetical protein H9P43_000353 [Blastocladiella emersonii ATCC 22665]